MRIAVTGSIAFDYLMQFDGKFQDHFLPDQLDKISVSFLVNSLRQERGGCAANIAYSLALLGERPILVGSVGRDFTEYRRSLEAAGVDTSGAQTVEDEYTSSFFANTDRNGNQICSFYSGAMRFAKNISIAALALVTKDMVVVSPNDPDAMVQIVEECRKTGIPYLFDPGQQIVRLDGPTLVRCVKGAKLLILNEYECGMFKKKAGLDDRGMTGLVPVLMITLGENGSRIYTEGREIPIPIARPARILDPTGVGDAFRSGLLKGLSHGLSWEIAGRMGSLAAAYVLETEGAQKHHYRLPEFVKRYESVFGKSEEIASLIS